MSGFQKVIKYCAIGFAYFLIASIFLGIFGALVGGLNMSIKDGVDMELVSEVYDFTPEYENGKVKMLEISGFYGKLKISTGDGLKIITTEVPDEYEVKLTSDGRLWTGYEDDIDIHFSINNWVVFDSVDSDDTEVEIIIPEGAHFEAIRIDGASGAISISDISADKFVLDGGSGAIAVSDASTDEFLLDGSSGLISINNLTAKDTVIDSASGLVTIKKSELGKFELNSGSGMVKLLEIKCDNIDLESGSGLINVEAECNGDIDVSSGSGNVTLVITGSDSSDYRINVDCGSGGIWVNGNRLSDDTVLNKDAEKKCEIDGGSGRVSIEWK